MLEVCNGTARSFCLGANVKVLIVNDNALVSQAIRSILESHNFEVSLWRSVGRESNDQGGSPAPTWPDVALVDIRLPDGHGIEVGRMIIREHPGAKVLALTAMEDAEALTLASQAGFHGWILKDSSLTQLVVSIRAALEGRVTRPVRMSAYPAKVRTPAERDAALLARHLTRREREVLGLLVGGQSSQEISRALSLSPHTVRTHIQNILTKLQVHSRFEAASFAVRHRVFLEPSRSVVYAAGEGVA